MASIEFTISNLHSGMDNMKLMKSNWQCQFCITRFPISNVLINKLSIPILSPSSGKYQIYNTKFSIPNCQYQMYYTKLSISSWQY